MFYRIEIQRENGRKRPVPMVLYGQLVSYVRGFGNRSMVFLKVADAASMVNSPHLYNPCVTKANDSGLQFSGMELTQEGAWVAQTWKCSFTSSDAVREAVGITSPIR